MSEEDLERRLTKIEEKVTSMVNSLNRVNQATADRSEIVRKPDSP